MNKSAFFVLMIVAMFSAAVVSAAQTPADTHAAATSVALASGTGLNAELNGALDSKKAKAGDPVAAHITEAVKVDGKVVIAKGTKLVGHITRASARSKGDSDSTLAIQFDKALPKNGDAIPLSLWIRAIAAEPKEASQVGPDLNPIGGTGSAAAAGSPMRPTRPPTNVDTSSSGGATPDPSPNSAGTINAAGQLSPNSRGVIGLEGLTLAPEAPRDNQGSLITGSGKTVHLEGGTRLLLILQAEASVVPEK
jgi:hypothetical protein